MQIFIDESGDLGWILDKPYKKGGSSQYLPHDPLYPNFS